MTNFVEKMIAMGGTEWVRDDMRRIYFNIDATAPLMGFEYEMRLSRRKGVSVLSVAYARLNGENLSKARGMEIYGKFQGKIWYDLADGKFHQKDCIDPDFAEQIIAAIKGAVSENVQESEKELVSPEHAFAAIEAQQENIIEATRRLYLTPDGSADYNRIRQAIRDGEMRNQDPLLILSLETSEKYDEICLDAIVNFASDIFPNKKSGDIKEKIAHYYAENKSDSPRFVWRNIIRMAESPEPCMSRQGFWELFFRNLPCMEGVA